MLSKSGILQEEQVLKWLGIGKERLAYLRKTTDFPYAELSDWVRIYSEKAIVAWIEDQIAKNSEKLMVNRGQTPIIKKPHSMG